MMTSGSVDDVVVGRGLTTAYKLDIDGDGYGVGSGIGPDADENDPTVNTTQSVIEKYGISNFLDVVKDYRPLHYYYIDPINGNNETGSIDDESRPYQTWSGIHTQIAPGDIVLYRGGIHNDQINCSYPSLSGTEQNPIIVMGYPGEAPIIDRLAAGIYVTESHNMVFDGIACRNTETKLGRGILMDNSSNIKFLNLDSGYATNGMFAMQDLHNILVEGCAFHDTDALGTHGVYLGSRDMPNTDIVFRNNLIYNSGMTGFQHNGRVTNMVVENNIIHSCNMGAISIIMGTCDSVFRNNLCFNNNQSVVIYNYVSTAPESGILPYDQTNNLFENNTFWTGKFRHTTGNDAVSQPEYFPAVTYNDDVKDPYTNELLPEWIRSFDDNVFRNNIFVSHSGPIFRFEQMDYLDATIIENNLIYRYGDDRYEGPDCVLNYGGGYYDNHNFDYLQNFSELIKNNVYAWPEFKDVSIDHATTPGVFDFKLLPNSPAIDLGIDVGALPHDLRGNLRTSIPDAGCYEYFGEILVNGDLNADGMVNINDYIKILDAMGQQTGEIGYNPRADYDNNDKVTYSDFQTWYGFYIME